MPAKMEQPWNERREALFADLIQLTLDLDRGNVPHVSSDMNHIYVHFEDEDGKDIGHLAYASALHGLYNDVWMWADSSTECDNNGEPVDDLDIKHAVCLSLITH